MWQGLKAVANNSKQKQNMWN